MIFYAFFVFFFIHITTKNRCVAAIEERENEVKNGYEGINLLDLFKTTTQATTVDLKIFLLLFFLVWYLL